MWDYEYVAMPPEAADARLAVATDISKNTGQLPRMVRRSSWPLIGTAEPLR